MERQVLKPVQGEALVFHHSAGDLIWNANGHCQPIDRKQAQALREIYDDETCAAWIAGDLKTARHAAKLWRQLTEAMDLHDMWKRLYVAGRA